MSEHDVGRYAPFAYVTAPKARLYRRIMRAFVAEKERFAVHLRPEAVAGRLAAHGDPVQMEELVGAIDALARPEWGNLLAFPDTSRVSTLEDFRRRRMIYQLSQPGEAAEEALAAYDRSLGERGELQAVALENIAAQLRALAAAIREDPLDAPRVHSGLISLTTIFKDLADNAAAFMSSVQRSIDLHDADLDAFIAYKDQLIRYIDRFVQDLVVRGQQIASELGAFAPVDVDRLCLLVADRELADRPPAAGADPHEERQSLAERWRERWRGLVDWFVATPERQSEAALLRAKARSAVPALLQVVAALAERQSGRSDRSTDFLALAEMFAHVPDDAARHRLWRCAFGLTSARHLMVTHTTLDDPGFRDTRPGTPWEQAPPVAISARLRATGRYELPGPSRHVKDRAEARGLLAAGASDVARQADKALACLAARTPARLSELGDLGSEEFDLLLALVGDAIAALGDGPEASVASSDGGVIVRMTRAQDGRRARIRTRTGTLHGPDHAIEIVRAGRSG
ncbi:MAG: TIGR02677 family protein [Bifidobacteriaceae bacterium]|nr:TIGR02677 family protein [Bifidobacteriaceae bacterium]